MFGTSSKHIIPNGGDLHTKKLTWIPKMMGWNMHLLSNMAIFGIYVKISGGTIVLGNYL